MSDNEICYICNQPSKFKCGNCLRVSYCCKEHQKQDWKNHKSNCVSFKVVANDVVGRHLVATRDISEGEVILKEAPTVAGPAQVTPPVCLGCNNLLTEFSARDCNKCGWPVCSESCEKSASHRPECEITSTHKNCKVKIKTFAKDLPHPSYQCITVLRCLYLKKSNPKLWAKLMNLESHCEQRKSTTKYNSDQLFIAKFIPTFFNFHEFDQEEILKVAGIVQVNAHEVPLREPGYVAIYGKASFLEHNCRSNCSKSFTNSGDLVIRAATKISSGESLSICYTDPLWGKEMRINHLLETKFFMCRCQRCLDPTELGTNFNSIKCFDSKCDGYVIPQDNTSDEQSKSFGKCQKCHKLASVQKTKTLIDDIYKSLSELDKKNVKSCKDFLKKYENSLHPNHHLLLSAKLALVDLLGWPEQLASLKTSEVEWVIETCRDLYSLATTLIPAENRLRGVTLYQLYFATNELGRRKAARTEVGNLLECKKILSQAWNLLRYEPDELPEGKMALEAKKGLESLEAYLLNVSTNCKC